MKKFRDIKYFKALQEFTGRHELRVTLAATVLILFVGTGTTYFFMQGWSQGNEVKEHIVFKVELAKVKEKAPLFKKSLPEESEELELDPNIEPDIEWRSAANLRISAAQQISMGEIDHALLLLKSHPETLKWAELLEKGIVRESQTAFHKKLALELKKLSIFWTNCSVTKKKEFGSRKEITRVSALVISLRTGKMPPLHKIVQSLPPSLLSTFSQNLNFRFYDNNTAEFETSFARFMLLSSLGKNGVIKNRLTSTPTRFNSYSESYTAYYKLLFDSQIGPHLKKKLGRIRAKLLGAKPMEKTWLIDTLGKEFSAQIIRRDLVKADLVGIWDLLPKEVKAIWADEIFRNYKKETIDETYYNGLRQYNFFADRDFKPALSYFHSSLRQNDRYLKEIAKFDYSKATEELQRAADTLNLEYYKKKALREVVETVVQEKRIFMGDFTWRPLAQSVKAKYLHPDPISSENEIIYNYGATWSSIPAKDIHKQLRALGKGKIANRGIFQSVAYWFAINRNLFKKNQQ